MTVGESTQCPGGQIQAHLSTGSAATWDDSVVAACRCALKQLANANFWVSSWILNLNMGSGEDSSPCWESPSRTNDHTVKLRSKDGHGILGPYQKAYAGSVSCDPPRNIDRSSCLRFETVRQFGSQAGWFEGLKTRVHTSSCE